MRLCPVCKKEYDDDLEVCPEDGEALLEAGEALPENPELQDVIAVDPDEATAMVDIDRLQPRIAERHDERAEEEQRRAEEDAQRRAEEEARADPEATGTMLAPGPSTSRLAAEDEDFDPDMDGTAPMLPDGAAVSRQGNPFDGDAKTERVKRAKGGDSQPKKSKRGCVAVFIVIFGLLAAGGVGVGIWMTYGPRSGEVLTVTTVPPGAMVIIDGAQAGTAPLQKRVKAGSHIIELELEGYEKFKEVVEVKASPESPDDNSFLQPLKALPPEKKVAPAADGGPAPSETGSDEKAEKVDELVAKIEKHLEQDEVDDAVALVKELMRLAPDDERADKLFDRVTDSRIAASKARGRGKRKGRKGRRGGGSQDDDDEGGATGGRTKEGPVSVADVPKAERKERSRSAYAEGERMFKNGRLEDAKRLFRRSAALDNRFALPHRSIARIYQREGNVDRARFHLKRYLKLGGPDADMRVKRWLDENK